MSHLCLCFQHALCPSLFLSWLISSSSHTFFPPSMLTLSLIPPCSIVRYSTMYVWLFVCVCVSGQRGNIEVGERAVEREQWCVQHLNCLFISSHCINYTDTAYKWVFGVCLCVCMWWGRERETIKDDRYGNFCAVVCIFWLLESHWKHTGGRGRDSFLSPGSDAEEPRTVFWLRYVWQSVSSCTKSAWLSAWRGPHGCVCGQWLPWDQEPDRQLSVWDRLQWLVEHSGQNLSDSAKAMNHFGLQLCNLSPTSLRITASMRLAFAHLMHAQVPRIVPTPLRAGHIWIHEFMNGEMLANHTIPCMTKHFTKGRFTASMSTQSD